MSLYHSPTPSEHRKYLTIFLLALLKKRKGSKKLDLVEDHFNQVVREAKSFYNYPMKANGFKIQSHYLAGCMMDYEDLKQDIMKINTLDDVNAEVANRILLRLEPAYARTETVA